jgi:hypothetical protein
MNRGFLLRLVMAKKPTKTTTKIATSYEDAVKAFLQTPPEKKKPKKKK